MGVLPSGFIAVRCPAANGLSRISSETEGRLIYLGTYRKHSCDARLSAKPREQVSLFPRCYGTDSKVSRRCWSPQCLSRGGPGVQYHRTMQRFVATKNKVATYAVGVSLYSISR